MFAVHDRAWASGNRGVFIVIYNTNWDACITEAGLGSVALQSVVFTLQN